MSSVSDITTSTTTSTTSSSSSTPCCAPESPPRPPPMLQLLASTSPEIESLYRKNPMEALWSSSSLVAAEQQHHSPSSDESRHDSGADPTVVVANEVTPTDSLLVRRQDGDAASMAVSDDSPETHPLLPTLMDQDDWIMSTGLAQLQVSPRKRRRRQHHSQRPTLHRRVSYDCLPPMEAVLQQTDLRPSSTPSMLDA